MDEWMDGALVCYFSISSRLYTRLFWLESTPPTLTSVALNPYTHTYCVDLSKPTRVASSLTPVPRLPLKQGITLQPRDGVCVKVTHRYHNGRRDKPREESKIEEAFGRWSGASCIPMPFQRKGSYRKMK